MSYNKMKIEEYLFSKYTDGYWYSVDEFSDDVRDVLIERKDGYDYYTPMKQGKEWLFELTRQHQPRTAEILLNGGDLILWGRYYSDSMYFHMGLDVLGKAVLVYRYVFGHNLSDPDHKENMSEDDRLYSLPLSIREAYYTRFDGLNIPDSEAVGIATKLLPFPSGRPWESFDGYLSEFRGYKKKYLPWLEERIPNVKPNRKGFPYTKFMCFLDTRPTLSGKEGDVFFVKNHIQDEIIYHIKDADIENMRILAYPEEAIDRYCEHVLLEKAGRFDFMPYVKDM